MRDGERLPVGYRVGDFEITGSFRNGYRARDCDIEREVAITVLSVGAVRRFQRAAKSLTSLEHANVGAIYDLVVRDGRAYLIRELVEGETLAERLGRGPVSLDEAKSIAAQVVDGVAAAHRKGIIHGDLSSSNVVLGDDGYLKILDFGVVDNPSEEADAEAIDHLMDELALPDEHRPIVHELHASRRPWTFPRVARWVFVVLAVVLVVTAYVTLRRDLPP